MVENGSGSQGGGGSQSWIEGGPVESMTPDAARAEIKAIENDGRFAGKESDTMGFLDRKKMLERRWALYQKAGPSDPERPEDPDSASMYDSLKAQGVTKESLAADQEKFADRDWEENIEKARRELELRLGGKEPAKAHLQVARNVLKRYGSRDDYVFLEESGLGNDPDFIEALGKVGRMLETKREELKLRRRQ